MRLPDDTIAALVRDPFDVAGWAIAADWLEEHDEPLRAEMIRAELALAPTSGAPNPEAVSLQRRYRRLARQLVMSRGANQLPRNSDPHFRFGYLHALHLRTIEPAFAAELFEWLATEPFLSRLIVEDMRINRPQVQCLKQISSLRHLIFWECDLQFPAHEWVDFATLITAEIFPLPDALPWQRAEDLRQHTFRITRADLRAAVAREWATPRLDPEDLPTRNLVIPPQAVPTMQNIDDEVFGPTQWQFLRELPDLDELTILMPDTPGEIVRYLDRLPRLQRLTIAGATLNHLGPIPKMSALHTLDLAFDELRDLTGLDAMTQLESLALRHGDVPETIIRTLQQFPNLRFFSLAGHRGPAWSVAAFRTLAELPNLRHLCLAEIPWLTNAHVEALADAPQLTHLSLFDSLFLNANLPDFSPFRHLQAVEIGTLPDEFEPIAPLLEASPGRIIGYYDLQLALPGPTTRTTIFPGFSLEIPAPLEWNATLGRLRANTHWSSYGETSDSRIPEFRCQEVRFPAEEQSPLAELLDTPWEYATEAVPGWQQQIWQSGQRISRVLWRAGSRGYLLTHLDSLVDESIQWHWNAAVRDMIASAQFSAPGDRS
ncbi:hypothetical protein [Tuwongella immobilis]|uniref:Leucine-rich repeat-containing g-protein coupled receptor 5 isoform x2: Leucine-rich repeat-containing G-protein-coupled receptor 5 n=1 Tax=Tuwongella immobilis TaxID=692036 RepID=A0A6C2YJ72_9BACT|nr:hypothetical protein [Tuwongella immobilis]VIP01414.1 leucine-rich repeat-containing g-protein coupled receptor 5 isoform x2 : Leucine-rich repeat-containing G-protein-coupled receptor 5 OS=Mus musculus GN=Lgr5 PE=4 SV=1 [Tuwongella immobilis]VTR98334.1 leucine-rich repeat-containing g-protein coupled receptor 5 isoform x2 : Leucine-rich repeat-containing G-protein-coupled receptor 5 OS=Mus musculus GN=Lgr5 PE=4 SV=1 [Tuwongella immobilis]